MSEHSGVWVKLLFTPSKGIAQIHSIEVRLGFKFCGNIFGGFVFHTLQKKDQTFKQLKRIVLSRRQYNSESNYDWTATMYIFYIKTSTYESLVEPATLQVTIDNLA